MKIKRGIGLQSFAYWINIGLICLLGLFFLKSLAKDIFPQYYFYYIISLFAVILISRIEFDILSIFSKHLYILSIFLLGLTFLIGQVTRGTVRWIPVGGLSFQPSEIVRPFIYLFIAKLLTEHPLTNKKLMMSMILIAIPVAMIFFQPSLGVSLLTIIGFLGVVLSSGISKSKVILALIILIGFIPVFWMVLKPYQKERVITFISPWKDPLGSGYNSIQAMIGMGSGSITGRGFGKGVQTQLRFLPERQTDFIYASIGEEFGFVGTLIITGLFFSLFMQMVNIIANPINATARAYASGIFLSLLAEFFIHSGMNIGILPVTGIPLIMVSAGGSSLLSTLISLAIVKKCKKENLEIGRVLV